VSEEHTKRQRVRVIIRDNEGDGILMSFSCEKLGSCPMLNLITTSIRITRLQPLIQEYCLNSDKYKECIRYKMKEKGEKPPENLLPNGKKLKF
jgi:hypothetical protein